VKLRPALLWRLAAAILWIVSLGCLATAIRDGADAARFHDNSTVTQAERGGVPELGVVADRWADAGWLLQVVAAALLALGIEAPRVVRRIFVSLEVLIAADGLMLLVMALIIR
jgi:hypothetical protein